jgi:acetylglutamate/LysW-gamma-L-alpha-aminoadipate kinase
MSRTVLKVGGADAVDQGGTLTAIAALAAASQEEVVIVHGGSTAVDETLDTLDIEPEYVETPGGVVGRFTDAETMSVFTMVLPGRLNTDAVARLRSEGVDAVGLSGLDGGLLSGPRTGTVRVQSGDRTKIRRGDHSGRIESVNDTLLAGLLADGYTPVVSPPMAGADDGAVVPVNTDADRAAAAIAAALEARLVLLTDVPGVLADAADPTTLIETVRTPADWSRLVAAAEGFMQRKCMAIEEALAGGASRAIVAGATGDRPARAALDGAGTHVYPDAVAEGAT